MARTRKNTEDAWMPPRVYRGRSAYEFHQKNGGAIRLCNIDLPQSKVWAAYESLINEIPDDKLLASLADRFFKSADFFELTCETQKDYLKYSKNVLSVFGAMPLMQSNLSTSENIWTSADLKAACRPTAKKPLCHECTVGDMSVAWSKVIPPKELGNSRRCPGIDM